jgi:thioesterase domain-containing protein
VLGRGADRKIAVRDAIAHIQYLAARARLLVTARVRRRLAISPLATLLPQADGAAGMANDTAGRNYVPQPTPVRALQFIAAGQPIATRILDDPRLEWRRFALDGFESYQTPGGHHSMLLEPNVQNLAAQLQHALSLSSVAVDASVGSDVQRALGAAV